MTWEGRARATLRGFAGLAWLAALAALGLWAIGRAFTDRWLWSQYLWWAPGVVVLPIVGVALFLASGAHARLARGPGKPAPARWPRWLSGLAWLVAAAHFVRSDLWPALPVRVASPNPLTVVHWNASDQVGESWAGKIHSRRPHLLIVNPATSQRWDQIITLMQPRSVVYPHGFAVFSRHPILRWGATTLGVDPGEGIDPRKQNWQTSRVDPGRAAFLVLDAGWRRPIIVWLVDLPSDVSLHRWRVTSEAAQAVRAYRGPEWVRRDTPSIDTWVARDAQSTGFPSPDVIIGDFNIPRGSASLQNFVGNLRDAYRERGMSYGASWPRHLPLWAIDLAFVNPELTIAEYKVFDIGEGTHRPQALRLNLP